jgi:DNA-binding XRE family transcriptional regulator
LSGKRIIQRQVSLYMSKRQQGCSQVTAAAKADISERSGRRIEKGERKSIPTKHNLLTRQDPFSSPC